MPGRVLFIMGLHSHQPVGNFDFVFEEATKICYHPFLEVLARYPQIRLSLHYSGVLMKWLEQHRPDTFALLKKVIDAGQVEMMGGGFEEPILVMLPDRDRLGQMRRQNEYIERHFGVRPRGMWLTERVWEQGLVQCIADSGYEYAPLDDSHFKFAGIAPERLNGYYVTEDRGRVLNLFPMDEYLRYAIPFQDVEKTIEYLGKLAADVEQIVVTYADDGEKFGSWPGTNDLVYRRGWLDRFFKALVDNAHWIETIPFSEALSRVPPLGLAFLPDASYREMMEWVLPVKTQWAYEDIKAEFQHGGMWDRAKFFVKGGLWRSFRSKYPEANEMYSKMMYVSDKVERIRETDPAAHKAACAELYQGQCNCPYWHGVFGGLYLPHLRYAIYQHLIAAENIVDQVLHREVESQGSAVRRARAEAMSKGASSALLEGGSAKPEASLDDWCDTAILDFNFDRRQEVVLASKHTSLVLAPHRGGHLFEFDLRDKAFNPLAVLTRRPEAYHRKVLQAKDHQHAEGEVASIHDAVVFKSEGLDKLLNYDPYKREGLVDHVLSPQTTLEDFIRADFKPLGDFTEGEYTFEIEKTPGGPRLHMKRDGFVLSGEEQAPLTVRKLVLLDGKRNGFTVEYELSTTSGRKLSFVFGVEMNYAMLAAHAPDRFYYRERPENKLGELSTRLDEGEITRFGLIDGWQQIDIAHTFSLPAHIWTFPLETVSQSEGGFESVYQASVILGRWAVELVPGRPWTLRIEIDA